QVQRQLGGDVLVGQSTHPVGAEQSSHVLCLVSSSCGRTRLGSSESMPYLRGGSGPRGGAGPVPAVGGRRHAVLFAPGPGPDPRTPKAGGSSPPTGLPVVRR